MGTKIDLAGIPAGVRYLERDEWGLTDAEGRRRGLNVQPNGLPELYIHHTAGSTPNLTAAVWDDDPVAFIQNADHMATSGELNEVYRAIAYSWMIHKAPSGTVTIIEARGDFYPAATKSRNAISKAFCFAGNFDTRSGPRLRRSPRQRELDAARWLRSALIRADVLNANVVGRGHNQNPSCLACTTCPGNLLTPHLSYILSDMPLTDPVPAPPPAPSPQGVLPDMYLFKYRKPGWPGEFIARVTASRIDHAQNADATVIDEAAGVTVFEATKKEQAVALLSDKGRTHHGTGNPFVGPYADPDLHGLW